LLTNDVSVKEENPYFLINENVIEKVPIRGAWCERDTGTLNCHVERVYPQISKDYLSFLENSDEAVGTKNFSDTASVYISPFVFSNKTKDLGCCMATLYAGYIGVQRSVFFFFKKRDQEWTFYDQYTTINIVDRKNVDPHTVPKWEEVFPTGNE
jgi:hypothetical protein